MLLFQLLLLLQDMIVVFFFSALYSLLSLLLAVGKCKPCCSAGVALFQLPLLFWFLMLLQIAVLLQTLLLLLHVMFVVIVLLFNFLYNADASSTHMESLASGRSPHSLDGTVHSW